MKDADHLLTADPHRQEARAEGHQKEEAALQEQEAAGHLQETATEGAVAGGIVHHPGGEAVHQADVDAEKVILLRTDDIEIDRASKKIELRLYFSYLLIFKNKFYGNKNRKQHSWSHKWKNSTI